MRKFWASENFCEQKYRREIVNLKHIIKLLICLLSLSENSTVVFSAQPWFSWIFFAKFGENNFFEKYFREILHFFRFIHFREKFAKYERKFSHFFVKVFVSCSNPSCEPETKDPFKHLKRKNKSMLIYI